jgi:DNA-binding XRE family transcriptional regulator
MAELVIYKGLAIRQKAGLSQQELGRKAHVSRATISDLESGKKTDVKMSTLSNIAAVLNCKVSDLFTQKV